MRIDQQPGYILHARPYRETSVLLEVLTRDHGRVGLVARGVRRERSRWPRGLLQPMRCLLLDWIAKGELGTLVGADSDGAPAALAGDALLAAIYVNELVSRMGVRHDVHSGLFERYATCISRLAGPDPLGWTLRRFERDFLAATGYAMVLDRAGDDALLEPDREYAYDPESGPIAVREDLRWPRVAGAALLALDADVLPDAAQLEQLRRLVRVVVRHHLGGELVAWGLATRPAKSST